MPELTQQEKDDLGARSECTCGHLQAGKTEFHHGSQFDPNDGHGPCMFIDCPCQQFTWKQFRP